MELSDNEYKLLYDIAYCATGMFEAENQSNFGDANEWKYRLKQCVDEYEEADYVYKRYLEKHKTARSNQ
jgi:hypothetical protein